MREKMDSVQLNAPMYQSSDLEQRKRGIPGSTIKIIAVVTMLIDHVAAALLTRMLIVNGLYEVSVSGDYAEIMRWVSENAVLYYGVNAMRMIGRLGFPIFCFLLVEGFQKTRNIGKYIFRLGLFALISEIPFDLACSGKILEFGYQNVYFTLFIGILSLCAFEFFSKHDVRKALQVLLTIGGILILPGYGAAVVLRVISNLMLQLGLPVSEILGGEKGVIMLFAVIYIVLIVVMLVVYALYRRANGAERAWRMCADMAALGVAMFLADNLHTDYSGMGVLTIAVMYLFRKNKVTSMLSGCIVLTLMSIGEITAFFALIPIAFYNGERGLKMKYFFYAFYPAHLLIIWLIAAAMGMGWISAV